MEEKIMCILGLKMCMYNSILIFLIPQVKHATSDTIVVLCMEARTCQLYICYFSAYLDTWLQLSLSAVGGREIAQSLASLSTKQAIRVRARLDPLVTERWNSITVLFARSHQCRRLVHRRPSMCYYVCVIMHVKDP